MLPESRAQLKVLIENLSEGQWYRLLLVSKYHISGVYRVTVIVINEVSGIGCSSIRSKQIPPICYRKETLHVQTILTYLAVAWNP